MQDAIPAVVRIGLPAGSDDPPIRKAHPRHLFNYSKMFSS